MASGCEDSMSFEGGKVDLTCDLLAGVEAFWRAFLNIERLF